LVEGDGADSADTLDLLLLSQGGPSGTLSFRNQRFGHALLDPSRCGESLGPLSHKQDWPARLHDCSREHYGISDPFHSADGSGCQVSAVHDRGVEFYLPIPIETGASAGVEDRIILQCFDYLLDGLHCGASRYKYLPSIHNGCPNTISP
jgi:hypothetical protein